MARKLATRRPLWKNSKLTKAQKETFKKYPLVHVVWMDAFSPGGSWQYPQDYSAFINSESNLVSDVGHLVEANDNYIVLAARVSAEGVPGQVIKIPRTWAAITKIKI